MILLVEKLRKVIEVFGTFCFIHLVYFTNVQTAIATIIWEDQVAALLIKKKIPKE